MTKLDLKECPFCGHSNPRLNRRTGVTGTAVKTKWLRENVKCQNKKCGAEGAVFKRPGEAALAWNTRVSSVDALTDVEYHVVHTMRYDQRSSFQNIQDAILSSFDRENNEPDYDLFVQQTEEAARKLNALWKLRSSDPVAWRYRTAAHRDWHLTDKPLDARYEKEDGSEVQALGIIIGNDDPEI